MGHMELHAQSSIAHCTNISRNGKVWFNHRKYIYRICSSKSPTQKKLAKSQNDFYGLCIEVITTATTTFILNAIRAIWLRWGWEVRDDDDDNNDDDDDDVEVCTRDTQNCKSF